MTVAGGVGATIQPYRSHDTVLVHRESEIRFGEMFAGRDCLGLRPGLAEVVGVDDLDAHSLPGLLREAEVDAPAVRPGGEINRRPTRSDRALVVRAMLNGAGKGT